MEWLEVRIVVQNQWLSIKSRIEELDGDRQPLVNERCFAAVTGDFDYYYYYYYYYTVGREKVPLYFLQRFGEQYHLIMIFVVFDVLPARSGR